MLKDNQNQENPWTTLTSNIVYENNWIQVKHDEVINPSGNNGIYGIVHFKNLAIGVIVLDEDMNTYLVGQYRYPLKEYSWEIPEGGGKLLTDPMLAAQRELKEETGIIARKWTMLFHMHLSNSATDEKAIIYLAQDLEFAIAEPEDSEELTVTKMSFNSFLDNIMKGKITDAITIAAGLWVDKLFSKGELLK